MYQSQRPIGIISTYVKGLRIQQSRELGVQDFQGAEKVPADLLGFTLVSTRGKQIVYLGVKSF